MAKRTCFYMVDWSLGLAISGVMSMCEKFAVDFFKYFL